MKKPKIQYAGPEQFDNLYLGKTRGFVLGGAPSIKDLIDEGFDFSRLAGEVTIATNKAYDLLTPTYLVIGDSWFWKHFQHEILQLKCIKFCPSNVARKGRVDCAQNPDIYVVRRDSEQGCHLPGRVAPDSFKRPVSFWNNSGVSALRLAHILGLHPIYLVGFDMYLEDEEGRTHFHSAYSPERVAATTVCRYDNFLQAFEVTIKEMRRKLIRIYSCSPISRLNPLIPFKDIREVV